MVEKALCTNLSDLEAVVEEVVVLKMGKLALLLGSLLAWLNCDRFHSHVMSCLVEGEEVVVEQVRISEGFVKSTLE